MERQKLNSHMICACICVASATVLALMAIGVGPTGSGPEIAAIAFLSNITSYAWIHADRFIRKPKPPTSGISDQERRIMDITPAALYGAATLNIVAVGYVPQLSPLNIGLLSAAALSAANSAFHHANWRTPD